MKIRIQALLVIMAILISLDTAAEEKITYKWSDAKGEIHYTERPPKNVEYTRIITHVGAADTAPPSAPKPSEPATSTKIKEENAYGNWRDENCKIATQNLDVLKNASRISIDDGLGGKQLMSEEQKQEKITQMEKQRDKYCKKEETKKEK